MFPQPGVPATAARLPLDLRRVPWIRRLATDYACAHELVADFFAGDPASPAAWRDAIARAQQHARPRAAIARLVEDQLRERDAPAPARAAAAALADPRAVAVVTGQQAGLFGGPLFTLLKAVSAVQLADRVRATSHVPAVAIFWIDAEDHDWSEVRACGVLDRELQRRPISVGDPPGAHERPVAQVRLDGSVAQALDELESILPATEFTPDLLAGLRRTYRPGAGMSHAFAQWMDSILGPHGLVVYDAADPRAKPLAADLFAREIEAAGGTARLALEAGAALQARGYHAQATPQEGSVALFHLNAGRAPIRVEDGGFRVGERTESRTALVAQVRATPELFSPNVLLRPIVQDALFPTACYVAGPNELGYLAQLARIYRAFGVPMPLVQPRATATLLDSNAMRFLSRYEVALPALQAQDEGALNDLLASQLPPQVEEALDAARRAVEERMQTLAEAVPRIDPTLEGAVRSTLSRIQEDLKKIHGKIIQAAKRRDDTLRRQFRHAQAQAFPGGQPQEREVGSVYFLNRYGPTLVDRLRDELPLEPGYHWVLTI